MAKAVGRLELSSVLVFAISATTLGCTELGGQPLFVERGESGTGSDCPEPDPLPTEVSDIFTGSCGGSGCHVPGPAGQLVLEPAAAPGNLIGVESAAGKGPRVAAGDPDGSYLIRKVRGEATPRMPLGRDPLTDEQIGALEAWVSSIEPCGDAGTGDTADTGDTGDTDDTGTDDDTGIDTGTGDGVEPLPAEVAQVFVDHCSGCHVGGVALGGLALDADVAAENTVGVESLSGGDLLRVSPGDLEGSFLWRRITAQDDTTPMPQGSDGLIDLDADAVKTIEDWILGLPAVEDTGDEGTGEGGTDDGGTDGDDCVPANESYTVTYATDIFQVIQTACQGCHVGVENPLGGLDMDGDGFLANSVGVPALSSASGFDRIDPGNPDQSFLLLKLRGEVKPAEGDPMPQGGPSLSEEQLQAFSDWIADCASPKADLGAPTQ